MEGVAKSGQRGMCETLGYLWAGTQTPALSWNTVKSSSLLDAGLGDKITSFMVPELASFHRVLAPASTSPLSQLSSSPAA